MRTATYNIRIKKIRIRAGQRATKYEKRIRNATILSILKEYLKEKEGEATKTNDKQERREYTIKNGCSPAGIDQQRQGCVNVVKTLKEEDHEMQKQTQYNKIRYKYIKANIRTGYLGKKRKRGQVGN